MKVIQKTKEKALTPHIYRPITFSDILSKIAKNVFIHDLVFMF